MLFTASKRSSTVIQWKKEVRQLLEKHRKQCQTRPADVMRQINAVFADVGGADDLAEAIESLREPPSVPEPMSLDE